MTTECAMMRRCTKRDVLAFALAGSAMIVALAFGQAAKAQSFGPPPGGQGGSTGGFGGQQGGGNQGSFGGQQQGSFGGQQGGMGGQQGGMQGGMGGQQQGGQGMMGGQRGQQGGQQGGMMGGKQQGSQGMMGNKKGGQGMMGGEGENGDDMMGGSFDDSGDEDSSAADEARMKREEERMEKQQKKMEEQQLKQMKKGLSQFTRMLPGMKKKLGSAEKMLKACGLGLPTEFSTALAAADSIKAKIDAATTLEALEEVQAELEEKFEPLKDGGHLIEGSIRMCQTLKQARTEIKRLEKEAAAVARKAGAKKDLDLSGLVADLNGAVTAFKTALAEVETLSTTDPEAAQEKLEEATALRDDYMAAKQAIEIALNVQSGLKNADREVKNLEARAKRVRGKKSVETGEKIDTAELDALIAEFKQHAQDIRKLVATKGFDTDELTTHIEAVSEVRSQINEMLSELEESIKRPAASSQSDSKSEFNFSF